jgi:hypothetical protein
MELLKRVELAHLPVLYSRLFLYSVGGNGYIDKKDVDASLSKFQRIIQENRITRIAESPDKADIKAFVDRVKSASIYITDWFVIGPFDNSERIGFDKVFAPELSFDTIKVYTGKNDLPVKWKKTDNKRTGYVDFAKIFQSADEAVSYAYRTIEVDNSVNLKIGLGSNDGVKLWINGDMVHQNKTSRKAEPNQDILVIKLKKGLNTILLKVDQLGGGWGFYFSLLDS